jgi:hypothetical protein
VIAIAATCVTTPLPAQDDATQVYLSNGELNYVGKLDTAANRKLFALYDGLKGKPSILSIRSPGGPVPDGIELGRWVRERKLDVKVLEFCMSSCANYVFPAGERKIVSNFAVIGYHGGPGSGQLRLDESTQKMYDAMTAEQQQAFMRDIKKFGEQEGEREAAYFKTLGVRADLSTLGQQDKYLRLYKDDPKIVGWTYSLSDFERLGVRGISVINPPWRPGSALKTVTFVQLPLDQ